MYPWADSSRRSRKRDYYSDYQYEFNGNSYELDQVDELAEDFCEFLSDNARDITIMVYLSDKDTLIAFELETTFKTTDNDVSIDFYGDFTGSKNNTDKVYLDFYIEFGNYSNEFVINSSTKDKKDSIEKETEILLYKDGEYTTIDIEKVYDKKLNKINH